MELQYFAISLILLHDLAEDSLLRKCGIGLILGGGDPNNKDFSVLEMIHRDRWFDFLFARCFHVIELVDSIVKGTALIISPLDCDLSTNDEQLQDCMPQEIWEEHPTNEERWGIMRQQQIVFPVVESHWRIRKPLTQSAFRKIGLQMEDCEIPPQSAGISIQNEFSSFRWFSVVV